MLEVSKFKSCPQEPLTKLYYDSRYYTTTGWATSEYAVRLENLVLTNLLQNTEGYSKPENVPDATVMQSFALQAWARPTIQWSLKCESLGMSRDDASTMFGLTLKHNHHAK